ncbi:MAG: hypothetical protein HKO95_15090 [Rhodobacteraceae bacterium]|nr:hypothetical protein [Alphaproteobacteria bacterium]NNK68048.1 hypothetical protein [Paracoccaceae bacterium]
MTPVSAPSPLSQMPRPGLDGSNGPGKSAEAPGQQAKAAVAQVRADGIDLPSNAQGVAASQIARGADPASVFAALNPPPVEDPPPVADAPVGDAPDVPVVDGPDAIAPEPDLTPADVAGDAPDAPPQASDTPVAPVSQTPPPAPDLVVDAEASLLEGLLTPGSEA